LTTNERQHRAEPQQSEVANEQGLKQIGSAR